MLNLYELTTEFTEALRVPAPQNTELLRTAKLFLSNLSGKLPVSLNERHRRLIALVNKKFDLNKEALNRLYAKSASMGVTFNYHEKTRLSESFNRNDLDLFKSVFFKKPLHPDQISHLFLPADIESTIQCLHHELLAPTLIRRDSRPRDWSEEILSSLFGGFIFSSYPISVSHEFFDPDASNQGYESDFWRYLHRHRHGHFSRDRTLSYLKLPPNYPLEIAARAIEHEFITLANHGYLAIHFDGWGSSAWTAVAHLTLFAEKFREEEPDGAFFKWRAIEKATLDYVPLSPSGKYDFHIAHQGFQYKDTFVFGDENISDILLVFQKNVADETVIFCPSCRSHDVQGNSYSSLGVKSWECRNPLCPSRSKFNRGKRYSFLQLLKQQAIEDEANTIPQKSVRSWARDVQPTRMKFHIVEMLIRHYSLAGDGVVIAGENYKEGFLGRHLKIYSLSQYESMLPQKATLPQILDGTYFKRITAPTRKISTPPNLKVMVGDIVALLGDSTDLLWSLPESSIDGAVTSPPYYNARDYSKWNNIYCYLYDMLSNAEAVFRCLRPGAYYLFNIFDYFDNENNIALSAMGQKRMLLSAYCIVLFERVGFRCLGNIVWDKGDIEGKRAFNGGNYSPYYQAPFNCWEHILIFQKPGTEVALLERFPEIIRQKPVIKIVKGENRHGHTAPFPEALPRLLLDRLPTGATIVDPYAGSMTTGRAAVLTGHAAICIEISEEYFNLGLKMIALAGQQGVLV